VTDATTRLRGVEIVGEKVRLRPLRPDDATTAHRYLSDERVTRTLTLDGPRLWSPCGPLRQVSQP